MKTKNNWVYIILLFVAFAVFMSSYFYPRTRDEFYYFPNPQAPNPFSEFYESYFNINPRIGQFFSNWIGRSLFLKPYFNLALFLSFMGVVFLFVFRKFPKINNRNEVWKFLIVCSSFIFLINYFGEMFYYIPYNTNYTLTHLFYLLYLYLISDYYFFDRNLLEKTKIPYFIVFIGTFFMGWGNEHVPPVLLGGSFLLAFLYYLKNKKSPHFKILLLNIPILLGYCVLFFAPANKGRFEAKGVDAYGFQLSDYLHHWIMIFKNYFYYNFELMMVFLGIIILFFINRNRISIVIKKQVLFFLLLAIMSIAIAAYSPLQGTRLLFFSNSLFIIIILIVGNELRKFYVIKPVYIKSLVSVFLLIFFSFSIFVTWMGNENYEKIMKEISIKSKFSKNVEIEKSFDYSNGILWNRKILLDSGTDYLDDSHLKETSQSRLLKQYFGIKSLTLKKGD